VWTATALRYYLIGLVFAAIDWPLNYAFYARQDTLTPALVGVFSVAVYLATALTLLPSLGMIALILADSLKHISHAVVMLALSHRRLGGLESRHMIISTGRTLAVSAVMGLIIWSVVRWLPAHLPLESFIGNLSLVTVAGSLGLLIYVAGGVALGQEEMVLLWSKAQERFVRRRA
jgi:putative peptidoglycan lipid II flippase